MLTDRVGEGQAGPSALETAQEMIREGERRAGVNWHDRFGLGESIAQVIAEALRASEAALAEAHTDRERRAASVCVLVDYVNSENMRLRREGRAAGVNLATMTEEREAAYKAIEYWKAQTVASRAEAAKEREEDHERALTHATNCYEQGKLDGRAEATRAEDGLPARVLALCRERGWSLHWTHRGAYLHLEASELIEAVRGKGGDVRGEAADVLLELMSITEYAGIPWADVRAQAEAKIEEVRARPTGYPGEEHDPSLAAIRAPRPPEPEKEK